jgi:uncharacterized protein (TIGR03437 family)
MSAGSSSPVAPSITPIQSGLYVYPDLRAKAPNWDLTLQTAQNPVGAGQYVVLYPTGFGPTAPPVAGGRPAPDNPLAYVNRAVQATVGGLPVPEASAGPSPDDQPVFVSVNGVPSNTGLITVT